MLRDVNILTCLMLFSVYFIFDILYCKYILATMELEAEKASILSMAIGGIPYLGMATFISNPWYAIPPILGYGVGTYTILKLEKRKRSKNDIKNNT
jgi:hypothetical protein